MDGWQPLDPDEPVVHVSWFEADALARAHSARLPTEFVWEKAATWDDQEGGGRPGNLDQRLLGPAPVGAYLEGGRGLAARSACSATSGSGRRAPFRGYPGFLAHPYREYSEVFFGDEYRVLRGGSWATRAGSRRRRSATGTCRGGARSSRG